MRRWILALVVVLLIAASGGVGFIVGRGAAAPDAAPETVTEFVEITREVTVIPDQVEALEETTASETPAAPAPTETVEETETDTDTAVATAAPSPTPNTAELPPAESDTFALDLFDEAWNVIETEFDGPLPNKEELRYAIIRGALETLDDDFTRFVEPEVAARMREDMGGSVSGIGAFVRENEDGLLEIVTPIEGQPADLAGLRPGDIIVAVDGESVVDKSFDEVLLMVRGPEGSTVELTVERPEAEEPLEFSIVRTEFEVPVTEARMLENEIAYARLLEFNRTATSTLQEDLEQLLAEEPQALILDLRNNPGGFLNQSIAVADLFLPEGVVLYERNNQGLDETFTSDDGDLAETIPMVVLVNQASASASEIVAGALRDNERAILIGATTFGKGSVQQIHTLSDGSELRVTTARWYTPDDVSISADGLAPDIEVEADPEIPLGDEADPQLQRAIDYLLNGE